jgi:sarcosine/dimethylglycine N-methyltransferase
MIEPQSTPEQASAVTGPYGSGDVEARVLAAIEAAGIDPQIGFTAETLGALDHFHTGGRRATLELVELTGVKSGTTVLDLGAGLGGPARLLAESCGCQVTCLELSEPFCRTARLLNRLTGLEDRVDVHQGSALEPPFDDASFDLVWIQNVGMNIADKARLYAELARVLHPGGRVAFQEVAAGSAGDPIFPVPWADESSESFLVAAAAFPELLGAAGFVAEVFEDSSDAELARPPMGAAPGPLTPAAYIDGFATKSANSRRSLEEGRVRFVRGVFRKP